MKPEKSPVWMTTLSLQLLRVGPPKRWLSEHSRIKGFSPLVRHDSRKNNGPLQKSEPSGSAPSVLRASTEAGSYPTGSKPVTGESIGFCRCCDSNIPDWRLLWEGRAKPSSASGSQTPFAGSPQSTGVTTTIPPGHSNPTIPNSQDDSMKKSHGARILSLKGDHHAA